MKSALQIRSLALLSTLSILLTAFFSHAYGNQTSPIILAAAPSTKPKGGPPIVPETSPSASTSEKSTPSLPSDPASPNPSWNPWPTRSTLQERFAIAIEGGPGGNLSFAKDQLYGEAALSLSYDFYDSCRPNQFVCVQIYAVLPRLAGGGYHESKQGYFSLSGAIGIRVMFHRHVGWMLQLGGGGQFSFVGTFFEQEQSGVLDLYKRDSSQNIMGMGYLQTGLVFKMGQETSRWLQGFNLEITAKIQTAPTQLQDAGPFATPGLVLPNPTTLDVAALIGFRYHLPPS